jgi:glycosyltransferase involved in cell wall biosynthesis
MTMKIVIGNAHPYLPQMTGGAQASTHEMARDLARRGHRVSVLGGLSGHGWTGLRGRTVLKLSRRALATDRRYGYPVHRGWFPWDGVPELVAREAPDVAVVQSFKPVPLARAFLDAGVPAVLYLRNVEAKDLGGDPRSLGAVPAIANSAFTADHFARAYGLAATVIHPTFTPEAYRTETTRDTVTFINPHPDKGLATALALAEACPHVPFLFVEAWGLEAADRARLAEAVARRPNVTLRGRTNDMREIYGRTAVLLAPSRWQEAFGRVAAEAQFSGIPVIATRIGGLPEAVGPGGVLVPPEAGPGAWVAALRGLWDDPARYRALSEAARRHSARPALDRDRQTDLLIDVLQAAIAAGPGEPAASREPHVAAG